MLASKFKNRNRIIGKRETKDKNFTASISKADI